MRTRDWLTTLALPAWGLLTATHPRWRRDLSERWGMAWPAVQPGAVWIHASSVGEVGAGASLLGHLPGPVLLTADTDTGARRARQLVRPFPLAVAGVRPVEHPVAWAPLWAEARPRALAFVEGCYWPALAEQARRAGVPVLRISARAGPRTRRVPARLYRRWTAATSLVIARDAHEASWFRAHQDAPVEIGGDLKLAGPLPAPTLRFLRPYLVGASTRAGDDRALLQAIPPGYQLLLAPRDPSRAPALLQQARGMGLNAALRSALQAQVPADLDLVILDGLGELAGLLSGARAAFIGGTFDPSLGGHSPAEAAVAGIPVVAGPARWANRAAFEAATVIDAPTPAELGPALREAVQREAVAVRTPAAAAVAARIEALSGAPAPERPPRPWAAPLVPLVRRLSRPRGEEREPPVPVIAVGSRDARGPGKTSTARWLAGRLAARGHRVGIVVHGIGRRGGGREVRISGEVPPLCLGDEGILHLRDGHLVASGTDRQEAVLALAQKGATVVLLDDGLRDRCWRHHLDVEVIDARFPGARGPLPTGEARFLPDGVDLQVSHHVGPRFPPAPGSLVAQRVLGAWRQGEEERPLPAGPVYALCGLARAADLLEQVPRPIQGTFRLADHRIPSEGQAKIIAGGAGFAPILCTEKERVRLPEPLASQVWWRPLFLKIPGFPEGLLPPPPVPPRARKG